MRVMGRYKCNLIQYKAIEMLKSILHFSDECLSVLTPLGILYMSEHEVFHRKHIESEVIEDWTTY